MNAKDFGLSDHYQEYCAQIPAGPGPYRLTSHTGYVFESEFQTADLYPRCLLLLMADAVDRYFGEHPELIGNPNATMVAFNKIRSTLYKSNTVLTISPPHSVTLDVPFDLTAGIDARVPAGSSPQHIARARGLADWLGRFLALNPTHRHNPESIKQALGLDEIRKAFPMAVSVNLAGPPVAEATHTPAAAAAPAPQVLEVRLVGPVDIGKMPKPHETTTTTTVESRDSEGRPTKVRHESKGK